MPGCWGSGRLQQAGPPQELYRDPVNLFVAGFIGSPAMNFVTASLVRDGGLAVVFAGCRLPVPAEVAVARPGLEGWAGRELILGIRPAAFEDGALAEAAWPRLAVRAEVTEELGSEIHVIFAIDAPVVEHRDLSQALPGDGDDDGAALALDGGKARWTARVSARSKAAPGQPVELAVDPAGLYFFDPESGAAIGRG